MNPAHQVYWKELRLWLYPAGRVSRHFLLQAGPAVAMLGLLAVLVILFEREGGVGFVLPFSAAAGGASVGIALALDAFAGERERHTLETVLTSPITPRQLLWGKMLAQFTVSIVSLTVMSLFALVLILFFVPDVMTGAFMVLIFPLVVAGAALFAVYMIIVGNLVSLRSGTVKATGPRLMVYMLGAMAIFMGPLVIAMILAFVLVSLFGVRAEFFFMMVASFGISGLALVGFAVYLLRSLLRETEPERFRIEV